MDGLASGTTPEKNVKFQLSFHIHMPSYSELIRLNVIPPFSSINAYLGSRTLAPLQKHPGTFRG